MLVYFFSGGIGYVGVRYIVPHTIGDVGVGGDAKRLERQHNHELVSIAVAVDADAERSVDEHDDEQFYDYSRTFSSIAFGMPTFECFAGSLQSV